MPRIFDNIEQHLRPALQETLKVSERADFCVGYFNLRGWKELDSYIEDWSGGEGHRCRLLVGMQRLPQEEMRAAFGLAPDEGIDNQTALRLKKKVAEEFCEQLTIGAPTNADEAGLRRLAAQIRAKRVVVKLFLRHPLHAKLYLLFRPDPINPIVGYLGSSNLTLAGLSHQGELNVDVLDCDAAAKLSRWFDDRWADRRCVDISEELATIIEESWAREVPIPPYHIYIDMAYHLSQEARTGLAEFSIPSRFDRELFDFQKAAVKIAAHHLNKRDGVLIGDVVGLGKTLMASAVAAIMENDQFMETLIICPKNLVKMWEDYRMRYGLRATVRSLTDVQKVLPHLPRHRLLIIDESHNLRNRDGKRYKAIQAYIEKNECKVVMLTATPYNKTYLDLSNQLRLFVPETKDLGIRPERLLAKMTETEFMRVHQCGPRTLAAFEFSDSPDDWRELMRLYLVRRTRSFILDNYGQTDENGRKYLTFSDGRLSYFPVRIPKRVPFDIDDANPEDQYARMYAEDVIDTINDLRLPRYGLGNYADSPSIDPTAVEAAVLDDLCRAGKRLMGFCRTNLFKRLESSGSAFLQSLERHILRNYIYLHAIENDVPIPLGAQGAELLDARVNDGDENDRGQDDLFDEDEGEDRAAPAINNLRKERDFQARASEIYAEYSTSYQKRFKWLRPGLFDADLAKDLRHDARDLLQVLKKCGPWDPAADTKLSALHNLLTRKHPTEKVLVFSQFADTVNYLEAHLKAMGVVNLEGATGDTADPTELAWRFSPVSNDKRDRITPAGELRVLVSTDVLSEGQNLQDCNIVVNYDLPWAIIRLIQRVGRVDRIGQTAENILCYSFLPAEGVERIIRLRTRVRQRLQENAEVVGTDEMFFEDDRNDRAVLDLYNEKAGILDGDADTEVDLASYAYQIWKNATDADPSLSDIIAKLPLIAYSARSHTPTAQAPEGVLLYLRTAEGNDALAWMNKDGNSVTESQYAILRAAECQPDTPAVPRDPVHHELVKQGVEMIVRDEKTVGGQLGRPSGARFRTYERLKRYSDEVKGTLFATQELNKAIEEIYRYPLRPTAVETLNRQLRSGASDERLAEIVVGLRDEDRLCIVEEEAQTREPQIICSLGLRQV
ncbi:MAG: phospholipase D-like domain-containing protein [Chloroflexi bacterium]|nr:phospholipase D-like domain-containing protein [Chloroflexota bacterium]